MSTAATPPLQPTAEATGLEPLLDPGDLGGPPADAQARYARAARSDNTLRGYRSDWAEYTDWCARQPQRPAPLPATAAALAGYLTDLAQAGARVGTMSRRLSSIKFAHRLANLPDPTTHPRVMAVWEGIRRTHGAPPDQAEPLMPPVLWQVLDACPVTKNWATRGRAPEPSLTGARDRVLLLVGFIGALRRSELAALTLQHLSKHQQGLLISIPRSKTNQRGDAPELVVLPRMADPARCPVTAIQDWLQLAGVDIDGTGPLLRGVTKSNKPTSRALNPESINALVQQAVSRAGIDPEPYSAHSLRAGFVTYAHLRGASDRAIAHQTRHSSLATLGGYVRIHDAWTDNAATTLGL